MNAQKVALFTLGTMISSTVAVASETTTKAKPNILFILVDDLGLGDLSCQYAKDMSTPNIDRIFETGVRLDNFYANSSVSSPSRAALLTGRFPAMVGVPGVIRPSVDQNWGYFDPSAITMPQLLKKGGYNTALIGKWHLGWESPNLPNERGFDLFHGFLADMMDDYYTHRREGGNYMYLNKKEIDPKGHATELFTSWSVDYIKQEAKEKNPFFLYLAYNAPHSPLQPPVEWVNKVQERDKSLPVKRSRLIALIEHLDFNIGKVMQALKESGQLDNTLVVFTSDNGGDKGSLANNGPTRGAKGDMFEGGIRVPCALNMPGVFEGGKRNTNFIVMMDFLPTICELVNVPVKHEIDGISVLDAVKGKPQNTENRFVYWLRNEGGPQFGGKSQSAVRYNEYKLLQNLPFEQSQMFNLENDALESNPLPLQGDMFKKLNNAMTRHYRAWGTVPCQAPVHSSY